jgi:DNA-directed RNA polymerase specialized sigma subunit
MKELNSLTIEKTDTIENKKEEGLKDICKECNSWNNGKGKEACLDCEEINKALPIKLRPNYKVKAPPMIPLTFQEESYNPFEEINKYSDRIDILIDTLKEFPIKQELIFLGRYFLGLNFEILSSIFNLSESRIRGITSKILKEFKQNKSP